MSCLSSKEDKAVVLTSDIDIVRLTIHVHQIEEDRLRYRDEFRNKILRHQGTSTYNRRVMPTGHI